MSGARAGDDLKTISGCLILLCSLAIVGCGSSRPAPQPAAPATPYIHRPEPDFRVFTGGDEVPVASFPFEDSGGYIRATMEVESAASKDPARPPTTNDVIFPVKGDGVLSILFRRPKPGEHGGRVVIRCRSGEAESEAEFEPNLWFDRPSSIVTFESKVGEAMNTPGEGHEVVLARYVARNIPAEVRLAFKAVFSDRPIAPRVKAGLKLSP